MILGQAGELKTDPDGEPYGGNSYGYLWQNTEAAPEKAAGGKFTNLQEHLNANPGYALANNGSAHGYNLPEEGYDDAHYRWNLFTGSKEAVDQGISKIDRSGRIEWGQKADGTKLMLFNASAVTVPDITIVNAKIIRDQDGTEVLACIDEAGNVLYRKNEAWITPDFSGVLDISYEGVPIRNHDIWGPQIYLNNSWREPREVIPDLGNAWTQNVSFLMSSTHGWNLLKQSTGSGETVTNKFASTLPITLKGKYQKTDGTTIDEDCGVDDFSLTANDSGDNDAIKKRIWIMVPAGENQSKTLTCKAPVATNAQMKISASGITADSVSAYESEINLTTNLEETKDDIQPDIQLNKGAAVGATATNHPIGIKVMKERKIRVNLYRVSLKQGDKVYKPDIGDPVPGQPGVVKVSATDITNHLNDIYKPQLNVNFEISEKGEFEVEWGKNIPDFNDALSVGTTTDLTADQSSIIHGIAGGENNWIDGSTDINLFLVSCLCLNDVVNRKIIGGICPLVRNDDHGYCWVAANKAIGYGSKAQMLNVIGHEIGHRVIGPGHPNDTNGKYGPARLQGSSVGRRLMYGGNADVSNPGSLIVKQEWDAAEEWLSKTPIPN